MNVDISIGLQVEHASVLFGSVKTALNSKALSLRDLQGLPKRIRKPVSAFGKKPCRIFVMPLITVLLLLIGQNSVASQWHFGGNLKAFAAEQHYPSNSAYRQLYGNGREDQRQSARLQMSFESGSWSFNTDYELARVKTTISNLDPAATAQYPDDSHRLFNLSEVLSEHDETLIYHRLDRFILSYRDNANVVKMGRQALSWGNGLFFAPMDLFNPFNPAAIDKEFKPGDDMLYGQHVFKDGSDVQAVWVARRDASSRHHDDVDSFALKYHAFVGESEVDFLVARHFNDNIAGLGVATSVGDGVLRGDLVLSDTGKKRRGSGVVNYSYSWVMAKKNMSGSLEYFYSGFGLSKNDYASLDPVVDSDLYQRLARGELFVRGRNYLALSVLTEMTPLWNMTLSDFHNLDDSSGLLQLVSQHSLTQNMQAYIALALPYGGQDTEFGGLSVPASKKYFSQGWNLSTQLSYYF